MNVFINSFAMVAGIVLAFIFSVWIVALVIKFAKTLLQVAGEAQRRKLDAEVEEYLAEQRLELRQRAMQTMEDNREVAEVVELLSQTPHNSTNARKRARLTARMRKLVTERPIRDMLYQISSGR